MTNCFRNLPCTKEMLKGCFGLESDNFALPLTATDCYLLALLAKFCWDWDSSPTENKTVFDSFFSTREHVSNRNLPPKHLNLRKVIIQTQILHICWKFQCTLCWLFFEPESACSSSLFYQTGLLVSCYSPQTLIWSQIIGALLISLFGAVQKFILEFPKTHKQGHAVSSIIVLRVSFNIPRVK